MLIFKDLSQNLKSKLYNDATVSFVWNVKSHIAKKKVGYIIWLQCEVLKNKQ